MQLYAFDENGSVVFVERATKQQDYHCIECGGVVRRRGGSHFQTHFYHLEAPAHCHLSGKGMDHLQTQLFIQRQFPEKECELEVRFPTINRIADVAWIPRKIIFEIQCSPITSREVEARNRDYRSLGWEVVWILHDARYNQWKLTGAEMVLRRHATYFTNIDATGTGMIYDQFDHYVRGRRQAVLDPLTIDVGGLGFAQKAANNVLHPQVVSQRLIERPFFFKGDLVSLALIDQGNPYLESVREWEKTLEEAIKKKPISGKERLRRLAYMCIIRPYKLFFQLLLERACR